MELQSRIKLPEGFRWLRRDDCSKPFAFGDERMDCYSLVDYYEWSLSPEALVIVREIEDTIVAIVYLTIHPGHVMIEMLARNVSVPRKGAGAELVRLVERVVAPALRISEVRLGALPETVRYYDDILGYEEWGSRYHDVEWQVLTPKKKRL